MIFCPSYRPDTNLYVETIWTRIGYNGFSVVAVHFTGSTLIPKLVVNVIVFGMQPIFLKVIVVRGC